MGFRDGEDGFVWFSRYLDDWGAESHKVLEVMVSIDEQELSRYAHEAIADEVWDEETQDFVKCKEEIEKMTWYAIPAMIVNATFTIRIVPTNQIIDVKSSFLLD